MNFYLSKNGEKIGPYSTEQIEIFLKQDLVTTTDQVWTDGWDSWLTIRDVPGLGFLPDKLPREYTSQDLNAPIRLMPVISAKTINDSQTEQVVETDSTQQLPVTASQWKDLGDKYYDDGVEKDYAQAFRYYYKAAEAGHVDAQIDVGYMYENGEGVSKDYDQALKWYRIAANLGSAIALFNIGSLYEDGIGMPKDVSKAIELYKRGAELEQSDCVIALERLGNGDKNPAMPEVESSQLQNKKLKQPAKPTSQLAMKSGSIAFSLLFIFIIFLIYWGTNGDPRARAIGSVLKQNAVFQTNYNEMKKGIKVTSDSDIDHLAQITRDYASQLKTIDASGCPSDFRDAFTDYSTKVAYLADALSQHPHVTTDGEAALSVLVIAAIAKQGGEEGLNQAGNVVADENNTDTAYVRECEQREREVKEASESVDATAIKYGVKLKN